MDERADKYFDELVSQDAIDRDKDFIINADELDALSQIPHVESSGGIDATEYMTTRTQPDEATMNVVLKPFATHENTTLPSEDESNSLLQEIESNIMELQGVDNTPFIDASEYSVSGADATDADEDFEIGFSFDSSDTIPFEDDGKFIPLEVITPYKAPRKDPSFDNDDEAVIPDEELDLPPYATTENTSYRPEEPAVAASVTGREPSEEEVKEEPSLTNRSKKKSSKSKGKSKKPRTTMHGKKTVTGPEPNENQDSSEASAGASKESARLEENVRPVEEEKPKKTQIAPEDRKVDVTPDLDVSADTTAPDPVAVAAQAPVEGVVPEAESAVHAGASFEMPENLFANPDATFTGSPADFIGHADYENDMDFSDLRGSKAEGTSSVYADVSEYASTDGDREFTLSLDEDELPKTAGETADDTLESVIANALNNTAAKSSENASEKEAPVRKRRRKLASSPEEEAAQNAPSTDDVADAISAFFAREDAKSKNTETSGTAPTPEGTEDATQTPSATKVRKKRPVENSAPDGAKAASKTAPASEGDIPTERPVRKKRPADPATAGAAGDLTPVRKKRPISENAAASEEETASDGTKKTTRSTAKRAGSGTRRVTRRQVEGPVLETGGSDTVEVINIDVLDDILETDDITDSPEFRNTVEADPHSIRDLSDASQKRPEEQTSYAEEIAAMAARDQLRHRAAVAEAARKEEQRNTEHIGKVRTNYNNAPTEPDPSENANVDPQRPLTASQRIAAKKPSIADPIAFDPKLDQDPFEYKYDKPKKKTVSKRLLSILKDLLFYVALPVLIAYLLVTFVIISARVPSESMTPTVNVGDRLFGFRLAYLLNDPERGDVVIFEAPDEPEKLFIKRIIGLPGDTVRIADHAVYITPQGGNEFKLEESYLPEGILMETQGEQKYTVPEDHYFCMGDNRNNSNDSRYWRNKFVSRDAIKAKAGLIFWPFSNFGLIK